ncbi:hypothetical protein LguiA_028855 [Lonicera macranthoides]
MNRRGGGGSQNSGRGRGRGYCYNQRERGGGRSSPSSTHSSSTPHSHSLPAPFGSDDSSADTPLDQRQKVSQIPRQTSGQIFNGHFPADVEDLSSDIGNPKPRLLQNSPVSSGQLDGLSTPGFRFNKDDFAQSHPAARITRRWQISGPGSESHSSVNVASKSVIDTAHVKNDESSLPADIAITKLPSSKETGSSQTSQEKPVSIGISENYDGTSTKAPFDICQKQTGSVVKLKPSLLVKNREKKKETSRAVEGIKITILRSGMILLKNYISCADQVKIVKICRELGLGKGGFYHPRYRDGADLQLKMMCLGKNWDPETSSYGDQRPFDLARPPLIPNEFHQLVIGAIQDSHEYLQKQTKERNVGYVLPSMSPNLCIVNFYAKSGRLGLHQDKDESQLSIGRGLPVVSFSIGDSAEFLYGDQRDVEKAEKVILESGDVLIFGGKSRLIFHGVKTILQDTAPKALLEESNLRSGRLNLTFREY